MSSLVTRKLFKTDELLHMAEAGVFGPEERVELIRGEILSMTPTGAPHAAAVAHTTRTLILTLGDDAVVWIQSTMRLSDDSAPQPDVTVLRPRRDLYSRALPDPQDVLLVVEVSDTSLAYDRKVKSGLYAEAGIPEYWLVDVAADCLLVWSDPERAIYRSHVRRARGQRISPVRLPGYAFVIEDLLPPLPSPTTVSR
jgi:Uma2 family endonuclease